MHAKKTIFFWMMVFFFSSPVIAGEPGAAPGSPGIPGGTGGEKGVLVAENLRYDYDRGEVVAWGNAVLPTGK